jgi:flagellar basal body-associated protein FliL
LPKARRKAAKPVTAKALIAVASVAITMSGWALFAAQEAPSDQSAQAVAYAQAADSSLVDTTHALEGLRKVTLPVTANLAQNNTTATNSLRVVTAPPVVNSGANNTGSGASLNRTTVQPRLRIRTRSSR